MTEYKLAYSVKYNRLSNSAETKYPEDKKDKKDKKGKDGLTTRITKKLISRDILKKQKVAVRIKEYDAPSVLNDENRFFKGELEAAKKQMFFE